MVSLVASIGGALIGAKSSKDASKAATQGQANAQVANTQMANQARGDVSRLFGDASKVRGETFGNTMDFLNQGIGSQITPFQQGNMAAQNQVARGLPQIQNAIMGNPVDLSGFQAMQIGQPSDYSLDLSAFRKKPTPANSSGFDLASIQDALKNLNIGIGGNSSPVGATHGRYGSYDTFNRQMVGK